MVVAIVNSLRFKGDKNRHTVAYYEEGNAISFADGRPHLGTYKAVIAEDHDAAVIKLRGLIREHLYPVFGGIKFVPSDFEFTIMTSDVNANGEFWLTPSSFNGKTYQVGE